MPGSLRTIHYGIGEIGAAIAKLVAQKQGMEIVGAIDIAADKVGRDMGEVAGIGKPLGVMVSDDPTRYLRPGRADVVVHSTSSRLEQVVSQLAEAIEADMNVVSSCEELSWPWARHPKLAKHIDELAKKHKVTVLGTGVNPGFAMDTLVLAFTAACQNIEGIKVTRVFDASQRRPQFQRKIGAGLSLDEFKERVSRGAIGHVGLRESIAMIADGLGWKLDSIEESIEPAIAERRVQTEVVEVEAGQPAGIRQIARGVHQGKEVIVLELSAFLGAMQPRDAILIEGTPKIEVEIKGGLHGDLVTAATIVNSIPFVVKAEPGLATTKDLPLVVASVH